VPVGKSSNRCDRVKKRHDVVPGGAALAGPFQSDAARKLRSPAVASRAGMSRVCGEESVFH
jgi:hypothetical protein